jgi:hypothetical protein
MTHNLRENLINSTKSCIEQSSYHGRNGVSLKDGEWQLSAKLARVLGVVPGTAGNIISPLVASLLGY